MNVVEIERYDLLRDRLHKWSGALLTKNERSAAADSLPRQGRSFRFFVRLVIGVISASSGGLLFGFFYAAGLPLKELVAGVICIAASELSRRWLSWRHTGAEEGWMLAGCCLLVFALPEPVRNVQSVLLLLSGACLLAGWRVRAPLFQGIAMLFVCGWLMAITNEPELVLSVALAAAITVALVRDRLFRSPFVELSLVWAQISLVVVAAFVAAHQSILIAVLIVAVAVLLLAIGMKTRDTFTLWSAAPLLMVTGYELGRNVPVAMEWKLMATGGVLIAMAVCAERRLRSFVHGWTSRRLQRDDENLLELAATVAVTPGREPAAGERDGGEFGGGGATERY